MCKIISVLLSVIMLFGIMSVATVAVDGIDPWDLADFGQKSWTIKATDNPPEIDGKINDGEYAIAETGLAVANRDSDDRFFIVDSPSDMVVDVYMNYDGDRFYLGVNIDGPALITDVAPNGTLDGRLILLLGCEKNNFNRKTMFRVEVSPESVSADGVDEVVSVIDGTKLTYEVAISKNAMLDQYGIDEFELVYIMLLITDVTEESLENPDLWNEFYFGFKSSDLKEIYPDGSPRYCHVVFFEEAVEETDAPETDAPETDAPETDAPETDAPETDAPETDTPETDTPETDTPVTDAPETEAPVDEKGCGSSIAAIGVALVATLGTCTVFVSKKR